MTSLTYVTGSTRGEDGLPVRSPSHPSPARPPSPTQARDVLLRIRPHRGALDLAARPRRGAVAVRGDGQEGERSRVSCCVCRVGLIRTRRWRCSHRRPQPQRRAEARRPAQRDLDAGPRAEAGADLSDADTRLRGVGPGARERTPHTRQQSDRGRDRRLRSVSCSRLCVCVPCHQ